MTQDQFDILEAENGEIAITLIREYGEEICLVLLDLMMPVKDGMDVLSFMKEEDYAGNIPVIMITGEATTRTDIQAYEYGVADIIYKPFSRRVVTRRAMNIIELYEHRKSIEQQLEERTKELRLTLDKLSEAHRKMAKNNDFLVNALSSVVEFRNLESGAHIQRVQALTKILLETWVELYPESGFLPIDIEQIASAAALHDLGKIAIPDSILLKPGKLTEEEFEIMKTHTTKGSELLERFKQEDSDFYKYSYEICRYHHERYNGKGYPDGLKGEEIPIWAQVVSIADVYDALVSQRVYKAAFTCEKAYDMIHNGDCGEFSPQLMACFDKAKKKIIGVAESDDRL